MIDRRTAMDILEIVQCEECMHWNEDTCQCERPALAGGRFHDPKYFDTYPDDFCSYGKRKAVGHD